MDRAASSRRGLRGPFARWPRASDAVLAAVLFVLTVTLTEGPGDSVEIRPVTELPVVVLVLFALASAALSQRRRAPLAVLAVSLVAWTFTIGSDYSNVGGFTLIALYAVGRYGPADRRELIGLAAGFAVVALDGLLADTTWAEAGFGTAVMFVCWYVGRRMRLRGERDLALRREREAETRRIIAEERTHIARELHDVVAHRVSMMTVQAGAAQAISSLDPDGARQAMAAVEQAGRQALDELRHLLGVLRPDAESDSLGPQPGLADLPRLIGQVRDAGLEVELNGEIRAQLPTRVQLSAYRIIQEALTNVLKHGGPGTRTEVRLADDDGAVIIEVIDDARPGAEPVRPNGAGHGLVGMRERAQLLGGTLDTGPRPEGGFRVRARLPIGR